MIINQATTRHFWPTEDPIGRRILKIGEKPRTTIGVVADVKHRGLDIGTGREIYVPFSEEPATFVGLAVRTWGDPGPVAVDVRAAVHGVDPNQPVDAVATMRQVIDGRVARPRFNLALLGSFAALALILAIVGIYGMVSYSVAQRTREIGVRMALGAEAQTVLGMVLREGVVLGGAGIALGLLGSFAATRVLRSYLFGIPPHDGLTFAAVSMLLLGVCLAASYFPARRAARVDPMTALRHE